MEFVQGGAHLFDHKGTDLAVIDHGIIDTVPPACGHQLDGIFNLGGQIVGHVLPVRNRRGKVDGPAGRIHLGKIDFIVVEIDGDRIGDVQGLIVADHRLVNTVALLVSQIRTDVGVVFFRKNIKRDVIPITGGRIGQIHGNIGQSVSGQVQLDLAGIRPRRSHELIVAGIVVDLPLGSVPPQLKGLFAHGAQCERIVVIHRDEHIIQGDASARIHITHPRQVTGIPHELKRQIILIGTVIPDFIFLCGVIVGHVVGHAVAAGLGRVIHGIPHHQGQLVLGVVPMGDFSNQHPFRIHAMTDILLEDDLVVGIVHHHFFFPENRLTVSAHRQCTHAFGLDLKGDTVSIVVHLGGI